MAGSKDCVIKLISMVPEGVKVISVVKEVFAEKKSITRSEFYAAYGAGMTAKLMFAINADDFNDTRTVVNGKEIYASIVKFDGIEYTIIRTFDKGDGDVEIVVR